MNDIQFDLDAYTALRYVETLATIETDWKEQEHLSPRQYLTVGALRDLLLVQLTKQLEAKELHTLLSFETAPFQKGNIENSS